MNMPISRPIGPVASRSAAAPEPTFPKVKPVMTYKIEKTEAEWKALLADKGAEPLAFEVTRTQTTERA